MLGPCGTAYLLRHQLDLACLWGALEALDLVRQALLLLKGETRE